MKNGCSAFSGCCEMCLSPNLKILKQVQLKKRVFADTTEILQMRPSQIIQVAINPIASTQNFEETKEKMQTEMVVKADAISRPPTALNTPSTRTQKTRKTELVKNFQNNNQWEKGNGGEGGEEREIGEGEEKKREAHD